MRKKLGFENRGGWIKWVVELSAKQLYTFPDQQDQGGVTIILIVVLHIIILDQQSISWGLLKRTAAIVAVRAPAEHGVSSIEFCVL